MSKLKNHSIFPTASLHFGIVIIAVLLYSCGSNNETELVENEKLVSATAIGSYPALFLQLGANQQGLASIADQLKYDITIYKIEYKTTYLGSAITASGLMGVPDTDEEVPTLSFQHGTIAANSDAPSQSDEGLFYASFASQGYLSLIPDFIGFGSSSDLIHPYYHEESTSESVIDMIRASKEFIRDNGINATEKLFLAGYSEGGYATMVTHKAIEEKYEDEFDLVASAPASGGYDLIGMKDYFVGLDSYHQPFYLAYLALSYSGVKGWTTLLSDLFNEPYASSIPDLFDGSMSGSQINSALNTDLQVLLTDNFRLHSDSDPKYDLLNKELIANSPVHWQPIHPIYMYHGSADITVPFENSQAAYSKLIDSGADPDKIVFTTLDDATHSTGVTPYVIGFTSIFADLK